MDWRRRHRQRYWQRRPFPVVGSPSRHWERENGHRRWRLAPIQERIRAAYAALPPAEPRYGPDSPRGYQALLRAVFPPDLYPRAWRRSTKGGPPGCAMAFGRALREMGARSWGGGETPRTVDLRGAR